MQYFSNSPAPTASRADKEKLAVLILVVVSVGAALVVQAPAYPNHDVSYLTWVAHRVSTSAVFGRDIREVNPPLAFLIYMPALFGGAMGLAIKLWIAALACLSLTTLSRAVPSEMRIPVVGALGLFFAFAFPREFGQREQIALMLCAPYVAGRISSKGWAILSGVKAGIGFALKPHFLIPLLLVFMVRRRVGTEEKAIAAVGVVYAVSILVFFQPYLRALPGLAGSYWSVGTNAYSVGHLWHYLAQLIPALALGWLNRDGRTLGFVAASVGFAIAVVLQQKFFAYHFLAAWGFLILFLAAQLAHPRRRLLVALLLIVITAEMGNWVRPWFHHKASRNAEVAALVQAIDATDGFTALSIHPYPAFPAAIYSAKPYLGSSAGLLGLAAIGKLTIAGQPVPASLARSTLDQVLTELRRRPGLVIVQTNWSLFDDLSGYDALEWLLRDAEFRRLWGDYAPAGRIGDYRLYRRTW
jgi:hypothetical protein